MPKKPMCGGKPVNGKNTRSRMPVTAKNAMDASWMRLKLFSLVAMDTDGSPLPLAVGVKLINLPYFIQNDGICEFGLDWKKLFLSIALFSIIVVAEKLVYTTTTLGNRAGS